MDDIGAISSGCGIFMYGLGLLLFVWVTNELKDRCVAYLRWSAPGNNKVRIKQGDGIPRRLITLASFLSEVRTSPANWRFALTRLRWLSICPSVFPFLLGRENSLKGERKKNYFSLEKRDVSMLINILHFSIKIILKFLCKKIRILVLRRTEERGY